MSTDQDNSLDPFVSSSPVKCPECPLIIPYPGLLARHKSQAHGVKERQEVLKCYACDDPFESKFQLLQHLRSTAHRSAALVGCTICDAFEITNGFADREQLLRHTKDVHGKVRT